MISSFIENVMSPWCSSGPHMLSARNTASADCGAGEPRSSEHFCYRQGHRRDRAEFELEGGPLLRLLGRGGVALSSLSDDQPPFGM